MESPRSTTLRLVVLSPACSRRTYPSVVRALIRTAERMINFQVTWQRTSGQTRPGWAVCRVYGRILRQIPIHRSAARDTRLLSACTTNCLKMKTNCSYRKKGKKHAIESSIDNNNYKAKKIQLNLSTISSNSRCQRRTKS